jgi:hypothetical protein
MSYFDDASLVMIPSGYKDQKVYSVKPLDGSGDLTFSRASNATRVASNGLIEKVRTNLLLQSGTFSNASWVKDGATFSGDTLTAGAGTAFKGIYQVETTQGVQVNYFDVAYVNHQWVQILVGTAGSDLGYANFDIQNKVVGSFSGIISATIQDFGTYVRLVCAINTTNKTATNIIFVDSGSAGRAASTSSTGSFKLFRAQNEVGDIATDYIATTSAAVSVGPVSGLPRLDYLNSTCPRLLLEPSRTNKCPSSSSYGNNLIDVTVSRNVTSAPTGYNEADRILDNNALAEHLLGQNFDSITNGQAYTVSCFFKGDGTGGRGVIRYYGGEWVYAVYNLATGTVAYADANVTASIQNYGNGWYRCILTHTAVSDYTPMVTQIGIANSSNSFSYQGASNLGLYFFGFQAEQGAYATSYIPTLGTSVTRVADAASKTGISSLIGQTEGTIFWEVDIKIPTATALEAIVNIDGGSFGNTFYIYQSASTFAAEVFVSSASQAYFTKGSITAGVYKCALAYANNNTAFFINGVQVGNTDTSCSVPATSRIQMGQTALSSDTSWTKQLLLFKTRLTNAQLAELTTL